MVTGMERNLILQVLPKLTDILAYNGFFNYIQWPGYKYVGVLFRQKLVFTLEDALEVAFGYYALDLHKKGSIKRVGYIAAKGNKLYYYPAEEVESVDEKNGQILTAALFKKLI